GWRQTEQTFDALRAQWSLGRVAADLSYATRVNRIFGPESAAGEWQGDIVLARFSRAFSWGTVTGFGTSLELDDAPAMSTRTVGLKVAGAAPIAGLTATYAASLARQSDAGRHPLDYSARYALVEGGIAHGKVSAALGVERL